MTSIARTGTVLALVLASCPGAHAGAFADRSSDASGYGLAAGFAYRDDPLPWGA